MPPKLNWSAPILCVARSEGNCDYGRDRFGFGGISHMKVRSIALQKIFVFISRIENLSVSRFTIHKMWKDLVTMSTGTSPNRSFQKRRRTVDG